VSSGIYRINLGNGNFYVGSSIDLHNRERQHRNALVRGNHRNIKMQSCWNKYQLFEFIVLAECHPDELLHQEQLLIDAHINDPKNANFAPIAGSGRGLVHTAETRAKLSALRKGVPKSSEWRAKMSVIQTGKKRSPFSPEWRAKLSESNKGKLRTPEQRANVSIGVTAGWIGRRARMAQS
jgi:group I intron endonuclease